MTPTDLLELPHTADEALEVLRAYEPAKADEIVAFFISASLPECI